MISNTVELREIWKKPIPQDCWASVQRISQLIDADSLDYCIKRWKDESEILYNNSINDIIQSPTTSENPLMDNSLEDNILDNLIGPYRKTELMLALLCIKKRNLVEFRERIEKILQLARQDSENDKLNKNFIGSIASAIKNYVTTPGGQYTCEIEKDDKCFEKGIKQVISSLPEYPKCHPLSLMYIRHKPEDVFLNNYKMNWKPEFSIPDEKTRIDNLEKKIPGITVTSPTSNKPPVKKEEKPSFLRRRPSHLFIKNRPSMRQNNININKPLTGSLLNKNNIRRRNMVLDLEEVNRLNEEKRLALKREEEEKLAAEKEKERKKKEEMARKQKEKEERERERLEKRKKKQKEAEEEKKRKEALKEAREKEAKEKEKKRQEAIAAAKEAKEKEAREKELRKQKEKEAKEKEKRERILQRENSVTSPIKRTRKKRRVDNESGSSSVNNSEATTPILPLNNTLNDVPEMSNPPDQNNMYSPGMSDNDMNSYSNDYYNPNNNNNNNNINPNQNLHDPNMMSSNNNNEPDNNLNNNYYNPNQNSYYNQPPPNENHTNMNNNLHPHNNNNYDPNQPPPTNDSSPYQMEMNDYSDILGSTNLLDNNDRNFIIDFLNGKKVNIPDEPTKIIPLNCKVYKENDVFVREIIEFEMNFQSGTWRKLKKIKKSINK
jgi:hypothetical protein